MRCQSERSSTARSSPSGSQKPARISISTVPGYDWMTRDPARAGWPGRRAGRYPSSRGVPYLPKSPGETGPYSALGHRESLQDRCFRARNRWDQARSKTDLMRRKRHLLQSAEKSIQCVGYVRFRCMERPVPPACGVASRDGARRRRRGPHRRARRGEVRVCGGDSPS
jgi:hypothetical protein